MHDFLAKFDAPCGILNIYVNFNFINYRIKSDQPSKRQKTRYIL